jgi:hypothetical protein
MITLFITISDLFTFVVVVTAVSVVGAAQMGRGALGALKSAFGGSSGSERDLGHTSTLDFSTNAAEVILMTSSSAALSP